MIVWFHPSKPPSYKEKYVIDITVNKHYNGPITPKTMSTFVPNLRIKKEGTKNTYILNPVAAAKARRVLRDTITKLKPKIIVIQDLATLWVVAGSDKYTLDQCRGSIYFFEGTPCIIFNERHLYNPHIVPHGAWVFTHDLEKMNRWATGKQRQEPRFKHHVCRTVQEVIEAKNFLIDCAVMAVDCETFDMFMTCIGYTGLHADGRMESYVIPFSDVTTVNKCFWEDTDDEVLVWGCVQQIHRSDVPKCLQNGYYDCTYFIKYRVPLKNFFVDSMHMMHSIWTEAPKTLNFISSLFVDHYTYWKDESKGVSNDDQTPAQTEEAQERYWRYCALDCYYTISICRYLVAVINHIDWAGKNYALELRLQLGPGLSGSMCGMAVNGERHKLKTQIWEEEQNVALHACRTITSDEDFNPSSNAQFGSFLYDVLGAQKIAQRGKATKGPTDKTVLKLVAAQHPIIARCISTIQNYKEIRGKISKYARWGARIYDDKAKWGGLKLLAGRFYYGIWFSGTETGRAASKQHNFRVGTNAQNIPEEDRDLFCVEAGYVFIEIDYSQSDAFYVAAECEDENYKSTMETVLSGGDSHVKHVEHFFAIPYDEGMERKKEKSGDPKFNHPVTGVRAITKRIVHGANFLMAGFTLYMTMGIEAVTAAAVMVGSKNAIQGGQKEKVTFCQRMLDSYGGVLYQRLKQWQDELPQECVKNGGRLTCAYGRTRLFFGNIANDPSIQRQMAAYFGQGGTAGNINRSLDECYYHQRVFDKNCLFISQTHDSILLRVKWEHVEEKLKKVLTIMEASVTIKAWTFHVPTETKIGLAWGGMLDYKQELSYEDLIAHDKAINNKYLKKLNSLKLTA